MSKRQNKYKKNTEKKIDTRPNPNELKCDKCGRPLNNRKNKHEYSKHHKESCK